MRRSIDEEGKQSTVGFPSRLALLQCSPVLRCIQRPCITDAVT